MTSQTADLARLIALIDRGLRETTAYPGMNAHLYDDCACGGHKAKKSKECWECFKNP